MKNFKKFISLILSCAMVIGLSITACGFTSSDEPWSSEERVNSLNVSRSIDEYDYSYDAEENCYTVKTVSGSTVEVAVSENCRDQVNLNEILSFANDPSLQGGEKITINGIGTADTGSSDISNYALPRERLFTYTTKKQIQKKNTVLADYFITSVARGETSTLNAEFKVTLSPKVSGETPYVDLELGGDVTIRIGITEQFAGPPEYPNNPNNYNCREYRVKFLGDIYNWTQTRSDSRGYVLGTKSGTAEVPVSYLRYSIDRTVQ